MALARSASGPGGLSINTNSANSIFGSSATTSAPTGMFGTAVSKPGGLFGSSTTGMSAPTNAPTSAPTGGLFGSTPASTSTAQPSLFGATTGTSGLFGSTNTATTSAPQINSANTGGLFGSATTVPATSQPQGGLFGSTTTQSGGLFSGLGTTQSQDKPASSLFGSLGASTQQLQQSSLFSTQKPTTTQAQPVGLQLGQTNNQNQQTVPGVRIDLTNIRGTTRFNDLHDDLQKEIMKIDDVIQGQIKLRNDCEAIMPAHDKQLQQIPLDVEYCSRKLIGVEGALLQDIQATSVGRDLVKKDIEHATLSFKAIHNLKLPSQYHNASVWSGKSAESRSQSDGDEEAEDLVGFFSKTADELSATLAKYQNNITDIEQHLRGLEANSAQQINNLVAKRNGNHGIREDPVAELAAALREFEQSILGVAGQVGAAREGMQSLQLGGFTANGNGRNINGKRSGVY